MFSKLRKNDEKGEIAVNKFLEKNFYSKFCSNYSRITDKNLQISGIDTIFVINENKYTCDEKSAIRYANKNLKTFSLELSFYNRKNQLCDGWFLDNSKKNNSYLFCWINKSLNNEILNCNDILEIEIALVLKEKIFDYLDSIGWNYDKLHEKCIKILSNSNEYLGDISKTEIKFSFSKQLVEKPINVLLKREVLKRISEFNSIINK